MSKWFGLGLSFRLFLTVCFKVRVSSVFCLHYCECGHLYQCSWQPVKKLPNDPLCVEWDHPFLLVTGTCTDCWKCALILSLQKLTFLHLVIKVGFYAPSTVRIVPEAFCLGLSACARSYTMRVARILHWGGGMEAARVHFFSWRPFFQSSPQNLQRAPHFWHISGPQNTSDTENTVNLLNKAKKKLTTFFVVAVKTWPSPSSWVHIWGPQNSSGRENSVTLLSKAGPTSQQSQFYSPKNPLNWRLTGGGAWSPCFPGYAPATCHLKLFSHVMFAHCSSWFLCLRQQSVAEKAFWFRAVCLSIRAWSCAKSLWTRSLRNHLREFHQIYNVSAVADRYDLSRFWNSKVKVITTGSVPGAGHLSRSTQPGHPFMGRCNEYQPNGGDALRLWRKGRYGSCVGGT